MNKSMTEAQAYSLRQHTAKRQHVNEQRDRLRATAPDLLARVDALAEAGTHPPTDDHRPLSTARCVELLRHEQYPPIAGWRLREWLRSVEGDDHHEEMTHA